MPRFARHTAVFSALTLTSRLSGLLRVVAIAAVLGGGRFNDAYLLANNVPNIIYELIMGGFLSAVFMPVLVRAQEKSGKSSAESWRIANLLLGYVGVVLAGASVVAAAFAPQIIDAMTFFARDASARGSRELAGYFFRFFAPQMFFYGLNAVFMAILNSHEVFAITAAAPILNNVVVIGTVGAYGLGWIGPTGLAIGTTTGVAAMALAQVPSLLAIRMPLRPRADFRDPLFRSLGALGLPVVALSIANLVGTAVRSNFLYMFDGGFTAYTFSFQLIMMPYGIVAVSIATVLFPALSRHAANSDAPNFRETISLGLRHTAAIMLPIAVGLTMLAEPLTRGLFQRGNFTAANAEFTARFLQCYAPSILPYALLIFGTRCFFAFNDTSTPAWIGSGGVALNIALMFGLIGWFGAPGVALASTLTYCVTVLVTLGWLSRQTRGIGGARLAGAMIRMAGAGAAMGVVLWGRAGVDRSEPESRRKGSAHRAQAPGVRGQRKRRGHAQPRGTQAPLGAPARRNGAAPQC